MSSDPTLPSFLPLPDTSRGYSTPLDAHLPTSKLTYPNNRFVVLRDLESSNGSIFAEHKFKVIVSKFHPNGEFIASGDETGRVIIWNVKNKNIKLDVKVNKKVYDISWSEDGQRIVAVGEGSDCYAKVFTTDSGNNVGEITGHSKAILSCSFKPTRPYRIVTCSEDNSVIFHEGPPFKMKSIFREHTRYPNCVKYSPNGNHFISVGADRQIFLFDGKDGTKLSEFGSNNGHTASILSLSWSPDSKRIVTCSMDRTARIWDVETGTCNKVFSFGEGISNQQVSTCWVGDKIISLGLNGFLHYLQDDGTFKTVKGHQSNVTGCVYDEKENALITSDNSGQVLKWNMDGSQTAYTGVVEKQLLFLKSNGSSIVTAGVDNAIHFSNPTDLTFANSSISLAGLPIVLSTSHKSGHSIVATLNKNVQLFHNSSLVQTLSVDFDVTSVAFSQDDKEVAIGGGDFKVRFYTLGNELAYASEISGHDGGVTAITYSPDNSKVVTCGKDRLIYIWDRETKKLRNDGWQIHTGMITDVVFAGNSLVTSSIDQSIIVWSDLENKNKRQQFNLAHIGGVDRLIVLNANSIVSTGSDRIIRFWKI